MQKRPERLKKKGGKRNATKRSNTLLRFVVCLLYKKAAIMKTPVQRASSSLNEWSRFLNTLSNNRTGEKPFLKKARVPERMLSHLESRLGSPAMEFA